MTKALIGNHVPLSASHTKPVSTSLILSVPAHTPIIHIVLTRMVEFRCPLIELQGTRTTGIVWAWAANVEQQTAQAKTELLQHSRSTRFTICSEYREFREDYLQ